MAVLTSNKNMNGTRSTAAEHMLGIFHRMFRVQGEIANKCCGSTPEEKANTHHSEEDGGYKYIPLGADTFVTAHESLMKDLKIEPWQNRLKWIDIGCGVGEKVLLANSLGFQAYGLELRKPLIMMANRIFKWFGVNTTIEIWNKDKAKYDCKNRFIQGDALKFDYKDFDVLYFYCPLYKPELQQALERRIVETAKVGAIVIPFLPRGVFAGYTSGEHKLPDNWELCGKYYKKVAI